MANERIDRNSVTEVDCQQSVLVRLMRTIVRRSSPPEVSHAEAVAEAQSREKRAYQKLLNDALRQTETGDAMAWMCAETRQSTVEKLQKKKTDLSRLRAALYSK